MNRMADARLLLVQMFDDVLPGRVYPYPTSDVAPAIWLDIAVPAERPSGNSRFTTVRYPVTVVHDGSPEAQIAGLDELVAKVDDAIRATRNVHRVSATRSTTKVGSTEYRTVVLEVEVVVGVGSFCTPEVVGAEVPPPTVKQVA